jgi:hypothetical protein
MRRSYLPSARLMRIYRAGLILWPVLGFASLRYPAPLLLVTYKVAWTLLLGMTVFGALRWLWHVFPLWARVLPTVTVICLALGFGAWPLLIGVPPQIEHFAFQAIFRLSEVGIFTALIGGFGMLVAVGFNQARLQ